ncbi:molecular chaperone [Neisseriaceae bacterium TC5R-5]|nr:molecular chaperone [Neisseriaceae bacterium TC5R-5]
MKPSVFLPSVLLCAALLNSVSAVASVVINSNRVIYPGAASEVNIQLNNESASPHLMQVWADSGDEDSTPDKTDAPFVLTPPLFRIEPTSGQTVRLIFTGSGLPQDRESLFFLNSLQVPQLDPSKTTQNHIVMMLRSRLKLFYRPATIVGTAAAAPSLLQFALAQQNGVWHITVNNPTGFHITLFEGKLLSKDKALPFSPEMVAPYSSASWPIPTLKQTADLPARLSFRYINDYGGVSSAEASIGR